MVQAWVTKKLVHVTFYGFFRCPIFALVPRFHKNHDILEAIHYNDKLLYYPPHMSIPVHLLCPWLSLICHTPVKPSRSIAPSPAPETVKR